MPGRASSKGVRVYIDAYEFSGYLDKLGPLECSYTEAGWASFTDPVKGYLAGIAKVTPNVIAGALDNTAATGLHVIMSAATAIGAKHSVLVFIGSQGAPPVTGDPTFSGVFGLDDYIVAPPFDGQVLVSMPFSPYDVTSEPAGFVQPFGRVLHAKAAETAANAANTPNIDNLAQTVNGGIFVYMLLSSNGTVTLSVDDSANGTVWAALSGATSGSINASVTPVAGQVALGVGATVREFLRWQLALGTATTATFVSAFIRA